MNKAWFTNNLGLKIIALALAIITWIYVNFEIAPKTLFRPYHVRTRSQY